MSAGRGTRPEETRFDVAVENRLGEAAPLSRPLDETEVRLDRGNAAGCKTGLE